MSGRTAFLYNDALASYDYGQSHPLKPVRLGLTTELIRKLGLLDLPGSRYVVAEPASEDDIRLFHDPDYLEILKAANGGHSPPGAGSFGLGPGDNPVFRGMWDWSRLVAGATLQAADLVDSGEVDIAFSISGGLHHALPRQASGFCYINDAAVAIAKLVKQGRRVAYVDIDAHHGDGVQEAFYDSDRVLTISIHETGQSLFPGTGFELETGTGAGKGFSVNVPLLPYSDDDIFIQAFQKTVPPLLDWYKPDIVVAQLGVDSFDTDPLTHLMVTTNGFEEVLREMKAIAPRWVALGGGGYDIGNVIRAWTLAWAIMNDVRVPDEMPADFFNRHAHEAGFRGRLLRDQPARETGRGKDLLLAALDRVIGNLRASGFPL